MSIIASTCKLSAMRAMYFSFSIWVLTIWISILAQAATMSFKERTGGRHRRSSFYWFQMHSTMNEGQQDGQRSPGVASLLEKIRDGRPVTMVAIGGSNTAGGGLENVNQKYFNLVADWWNETFSDSTMTVHDVSIGGTASDFYLFCLQNYLPEQPQEAQRPDIVLLELAVNDFGYKRGEAAQPMELLTRRLLSLPSKPLVMYVNFVSQAYDATENVTTNTDCLNAQDLGYDELSLYYGIPSFSIKDLACPLYSGQRWLNRSASDSEILAKDLFHVGVKGNSKMASMIINYFKKISKISEYSDVHYSLPEPLFNELSIGDKQLTRPLCWSHLSTNFQAPLKQTLNARVTESVGFRYISHTDSKNRSLRHNAPRTDAYGGWSPDGKAKNSFLKIRFDIPNNDMTSESYSVAVILRLTGGRRDIFANFSLDGEQNTTTQLVKDCGQTGVETYMFPLATSVAPGNHDVTIELTSETNNVISGLAVGYSSYSGYHGYRPISVKNPIWSYENYKKYNCCNIRNCDGN